MARLKQYFYEFVIDKLFSVPTVTWAINDLFIIHFISKICYFECEYGKF